MANSDLVNVSENSPLVKQFIERISKATGQMVTAFFLEKNKDMASEVINDLNFILENGQKITLIVRTDGKVVKVKLNGKDLQLNNQPFQLINEKLQQLALQKSGHSQRATTQLDQSPSVSLFAKAVEEIGTYVRQNQATFDKQQSQERVILPNLLSREGEHTSSVSVRTKELKANLENLDKEIIEKTSLRDELKSRLETHRKQLQPVSPEVY